jgi:hypothetical protein
MLLTWHGHGAVRARVEAVAFAFRRLRREDNEPGDGTSTLVGITLAAEGPRTPLRVVETGFQRLTRAEEDKARCADENPRGWIAELNELRGYAARLGSSPDAS